MVSGAFIYSLVVTDVCSGWTEAVPLLAREQSLVVEGLEAISRVFPVPVRGIDSDNDSVFINETLFGYCVDRGIEFTRSRAYRKNDQAWIEQKNGSMIRRFVGHERYSGPMAGQTLAHLYGAMRLYVNYFQPSFQLLERSRNGGSGKTRYKKPATPYDRLLDRNDLSEETRRSLLDSRARLTRYPCCIRYGRPSRRLPRSTPPTRRMCRTARVWNAFSPGFPTCGDREKRVLLIHARPESRTHGARDRTRSRGYGARSWAGFRSSRT